MNIGILGLPYSGKTTVVKYLAMQSNAGIREQNNALYTTLTFPDKRMEILKENEALIKITLPHFYIFEPNGAVENAHTLSRIKTAQALFIVLRNFPFQGVDPEPVKDFERINHLILEKDRGIIKKQIETLKNSLLKAKFKKDRDDIEHTITILEKMEEFALSKPLRDMEEIHVHKGIYTGLGLLSAYPALIILSSSESTYKQNNIIFSLPHVELLPDWELEKRKLSKEEIKEFSVSFSLPEEDLFYKLNEKFWNAFSLQVFYTVKKEDTRAWLISKGTQALEASGVIHTDIEKGFIKAEIISWQDYIKAGSIARAKPFMRLEDKDYIMKDGDIANFRFKV